MLGHKSTVASLVRYMVMVVLFVVGIEVTPAQTPSGVAESTKVEASQGAPAVVPNSPQPTTVGAATNSATATVDPVRSDAFLMNAKSDAPSRSQPEVAPEQTPTPAPAPAKCMRNIFADVVALPQPIMLNRLGAAIPDGLIFALRSDTVDGKGTQLKPTKRPRPIVLRANVGDCLIVTFTNSIPTSTPNQAGSPPPAPPPPPPPPSTFSNTILPGASTGTQEVSLHIQGMEWATGPLDDGSFVGTNPSSLATSSPAPAAPAGTSWPPNKQKYTLYAKAEGTFLLYTMGDTSTTGNQLTRGLFGALNVQPALAEWYRSQVSQQDLKLATKGGLSPDKFPVINYDATYPDGTPILNMLKPVTPGDTKNFNLVHSDLTAMITGPKAGRFPGANGDPNKPDPPCNAENNGAAPPGGKIDPLFCQNPASPDRKQPYRELTIIYHGGLAPIATQAFPIFAAAPPGATKEQDQLATMASAGQDAFAINYGTGGIGAEIYANRIGVGPMGDCVDCKFEEFFLSAWSVGDPAMVVDVPANFNFVNKPPNTQPFDATTGTNLIAPCNTTAAFEGTTTPATAPNPSCANPRTLTAPPAPFPYTLKPLPHATKAFYPDDPSNVYHSYINDHVKFRILHGGRDVTHVHHQHAHQWLQSPNSDEGSYLDSQMISPGASYTLEMVYNGSGNRNKVVGDSIFHCHFYPHFAAGMWAMWRTHDVFEAGSELDKNGIPVKGTRALPDGEIMAGSPNVAIVPLPTLPMAPLPSPVFIDNGQIVFGTPAAPDKPGLSVKVSPGFPFYIPGRAGARAPHPPFDFAPDGAGFMDGGLPRHLVTGGSVKFESHDLLDWSKDLQTVKATQLPEDGTPVEKVAIDFFKVRCHQTPLPNGTPSNCAAPTPFGFIVNGLPLGPQMGAPFADPAVDDSGKPINFDPVTKTQAKRVYKAAAIQMNVTFNKQGWHFPQQRMLTLWNDVAPTFAGTRPTEPLFFRGNSGDIIEYWHTNLVPNYYQVDDFQVRTPTDILGQHIHLVKFDVTSSDGAGNGFNYEDGTFAPEEVQELIHAIQAPGGVWTPCTAADPKNCAPLTAPKAPPSAICSVPSPPAQCAAEWKGAQTTIQRWYLDPLLDNMGVDRTLRTVFTHDHFGPSTHQQAGLYAGLLVEPKGSTWTSNDGTQVFGGGTDGGPTSWQARILTSNKDDSYREFMLEFQDLQLAYQKLTLYPDNKPSSDPRVGFIDSKNAINSPGGPDKATPSLISTGVPAIPVGTQSVNYRNEPLAFRLAPFATFPRQKFSDLSYAYDNSIQSMVPGVVGDPDPLTPLMRAYQNDKVQLRVLVGAHVFAHQFNLEGPRWFAEPSWKNSGYRSAQAMGLSEHFEFLFNVPSSSAPNTPRKCPDGKSDVNCIDYLYSPSLDESGLANGLWGLFRAYDPTAKAADPILKTVAPLPNNLPITPGIGTAYATCPSPVPAPGITRTFNITAVTAQQALASQSPFPKQIVFNGRTPLGGTTGDTLTNTLGIMYVHSADLDSNGVLKKGVPVEPLILRANAGDCIVVNLTNAIATGTATPPPDDSNVFKADFSMAPPTQFGAGTPATAAYPHKVSRWVGLHPQLLSYDQAQSTGMNIGWNSQDQTDQVIPFKSKITYTWYAGKAERQNNGPMVYTPVEFGAANLFPSDPLFQQINGLFGAIVIEPAGSKWACGEAGKPGAPCDPPAASPGPTPATPTTRASATVTSPDGSTFRDFVAMVSDNLIISPYPAGTRGGFNSAAVNYKTEPWKYRYSPTNTSTDFSCMLSNQLLGTLPSTPIGDPQTPVFTANPGDKARFRILHTFGTGTSQVFTLHGHPWQRNPYRNSSTIIGNNNLSQWLGSRDNYGSTDHADVVVDSAGGDFKQAGDYLYSVFVPNQAMLGPWGIFRVGKAQPLGHNPACVLPSPAAAPRVAPAQNDDLDRFIRLPSNTTTKKP